MQIPCVYLPGPAPAVSVANSYNHFGRGIPSRDALEFLVQSTQLFPELNKLWRVRIVEPKQPPPVSQQFCGRSFTDKCQELGRKEAFSLLPGVVCQMVRGLNQETRKLPCHGNREQKEWKRSG